jgi:MFS family permease
VLEITESSLLLGVTMALNFAPRIFGLIAGVAADRVDRRKMLITVNVVQILFSILMGILVIGEQIAWWHVTLIAFLGSTLNSFSMPARQAYTVDLVGKENVANSAALNRVAMFISGIVGPSLVGILVNFIGIGYFFYLNAILFLAAIVLIIGISSKASLARKTAKERSLVKDLVGGLKYSWTNKNVFSGHWIYLVTNIFVWPCIWTLMPIYARNVLNVDAAGLGWLSTANSLGSILATLAIAALGDFRKKGLVVLFASFGWGASWMIFSMTTWFPLSLFSLVMVGITGSLTMTLASVILLVYSAPEMRGRVIGIQTLAISTQSPGSIIAGIAAQSLGPSLAIFLEGAFFIISMFLTLRLVPSLRKS